MTIVRPVVVTYQWGIIMLSIRVTYGIFRYSRDLELSKKNHTIVRLVIVNSQLGMIIL